MTHQGKFPSLYSLEPRSLSCFHEATNSPSISMEGMYSSCFSFAGLLPPQTFLHGRPLLKNGFLLYHSPDLPFLSSPRGRICNSHGGSSCCCCSTRPWPRVPTLCGLLPTRLLSILPSGSPSSHLISSLFFLIGW